MTPNQFLIGSNNQTPMTNQTKINSCSPLGIDIPGEKKFVEVNTGETLIVSTIGIYASRKGENMYIPLQVPS